MTAAVQAVRRGWVSALLSVALLTGVSACGAAPPAAASPIPACALLSTADIRAAVGMTPSSQGGGLSGTSSTCAWALPNAANGSITTVDVGCGSSCSSALASLAPAPAYRDADDSVAPGVESRAGPSSIAFAAGGSAVEISVDHTGGDPGTVLEALARSALRHLG
jgi:hypothetical protein